MKLAAALGSVFGPSWGAKGAPRRPQDDTLRAQDVPKGRQDGTQDEQKPMINPTFETISLLIRLKAVLGRSWGELGPILGSILAISYWKTYYFEHSDVLASMWTQDLFWASLFEFLAGQSFQMGGQLSSKRLQERYQNHGGRS